MGGLLLLLAACRSGGMPAGRDGRGPDSVPADAAGDSPRPDGAVAEASPDRPTDAPADALPADAPADRPVDFDAARADAALDGSDALQADAASVSGDHPDASLAETLCLGTGGRVQQILCCQSAGDFPPTCPLGACACAPASSHP